MEILTYILIGVGILIAIVTIFGFASPRFATMERSVVINADAAKVYSQVNNLKNFVDHWSPWT